MASGACDYPSLWHVPHSRSYNNITQSWTRFPVRSTLALNQEHILRFPQAEIFILQGEANAYRGRLCLFSQCPKGKRECLVPGCGQDLFLQQHAGFTFWPDALAPDRIMHLYDRQRGILRRASETPAAGQDDQLATG